jgi:hypothetical protein
MNIFKILGAIRDWKLAASGNFTPTDKLNLFNSIIDEFDRADAPDVTQFTQLINNLKTQPIKFLTDIIIDSEAERMGLEEEDRCEKRLYFVMFSAGLNDVVSKVPKWTELKTVEEYFNDFDLK